MRLQLCVFAAVVVAACSGSPGNRPVDEATAAAIRTEIETAMRDAYDLSKPNVSERMLALYPKAGRIVSATGGRVLASRDSVEAGIRYFWNNVGLNMHEPRWIWERFYIDVLSPTAAVMTATYRVPHRTPQNEAHMLGGAMTAVLEKRGGKWLIVQEHLSDLPAEVDTSRASITPHTNH